MPFGDAPMEFLPTASKLEIRLRSEVYIPAAGARLRLLTERGASRLFDGH